MAPPWALDRASHPVATRFEISPDGRTLTQIVVPTRTTRYPIVADPNVNCGWVTCSVYLTRSETANLWGRLGQYQNSSTAAIAGAAAAACAIVFSGTGPGAGVAAAVCGPAGALYGAFFIDKLGQAANSGNCLRIRYTSVGPLPVVSGLYNDNSQYCKK